MTDESKPFFDVPPPPPGPPFDPDEPYVPPIWTGPSALVLGGLVPVQLLLARTDRLAISLEGVRAYPNGCELRIVIHTRDPIGPMAMHAGMRQMLRVGAQFSDGRRTGNFGVSDLEKDDAGVPKTPILWPQGGGGSDRQWRQDYWLWPLPSPGPLLLVIEWPDYGIAETRHELDGSAIVDASTRAITLWDSARAHPRGATGPLPGATSVPLRVEKRE